MQMTTTVRATPIITPQVSSLLEFFYPIHYKLGIALEDALRGGQITRKQVAILWLIRSEGENGRWMRRKDIERVISTWFEISSSAITKALRSMARPPLNIVQVIEDPHSGREKQVILTAKGQRFLATMVERGTQFIQDLASYLSEDELRSGAHFLQRATFALEQTRAARMATNGKEP
jgi:DNA-binding MarR family transcriptional regulator